MRMMLVATAVVLTMVATISALVGEESSAPVEDIIVSPENKLERLVTDFAEHSNTMSVSEMEDKLESWRNDPNTMLDLPAPARTQVIP